MTIKLELLLKHLENFKEIRNSYLCEILPLTNSVDDMVNVKSTINSLSEIIIKLELQIEELKA